MSHVAVPRQARWPFFLADALLLGVAVWLVYASVEPLGAWHLAVLFLAVATGCWFGVSPFLHDHRAGLKLAEAETLAGALAQLKSLEHLHHQIAGATSHWDQALEHSKQTVQTAGELTARMQAEAAEFCRFLEKTNDMEKQHLRLEVEKLRRAEGEWLQVLAQIFDHIYALYRAASRSGQDKLIAEIGQFQFACRNLARRMGLVPLAPEAGTPFDASLHQLAEPDADPPEPSRILETLATGFAFQGQVLRKPVVAIEPVPTDPETVACGPGNPA